MTEERRGTGIWGFGQTKNGTRARSFRLILFSRGQDRKSRSLFFAPKPHGNVCYAGYDFFVSFHINFRPLNSRGELRDESKERSEMARPDSLLSGLHAVAAFPCSSLASRLSSLVLKARNNNACSVGFCSQAS